MKLKPWIKLRQINNISNNWWTYLVDEVQLPSGKYGEYHYVHTNGSSLIIPVLDDGKILMVKQYRYLAGKESLEFPCGSIDDGATIEEMAAQELAEEAGVQAGEFTFAGTFNPYNGVTDEMCNVFIARKLTPVDIPPDDTEEFERIILSREEIEFKIKSNEIWDGMTLAAWILAIGKI